MLGELPAESNGERSNAIQAAEGADMTTIEADAPAISELMKARQFSLFHICLERANPFMLANTLCENLGSEHKDDLRSELVRIVANAPMITHDLLGSSSPISTNDIGCNGEAKSARRGRRVEA